LNSLCAGLNLPGGKEVAGRIVDSAPIRFAPRHGICLLSMLWPSFVDEPVPCVRAFRYDDRDADQGGA
jgi:hypothetical protein